MNKSSTGRSYDNEVSATLKHLRELEQSGKYLFHGSLKRIDTLEPRQPYSHRLPDGSPSVCASNDLDTAIFMALFRGSQNLIRGVATRCGYSHNNGERYFYATLPLIKAVRDVTAYIHVVHIEGFIKYKNNESELRATHPVIPVEIIPVTIRDFDHPVDEIPLENTVKQD